MSARIAVLQFPGVNCENESARALNMVGLEAEVFRATRRAADLAAFDGYLLPGGWSYQDRVRAGVLAAKDPLLDALAEQAAAGKPVLGICNGAQVLVEAGLVPGGGVIGLALARNRMPQRSGYYARWVRCRIEPSECLFTRHLPAGTVLPLPIAHGEGRFTSAKRGAMAALLEHGQMPMRYADVAGEVASEFPDDPNGAELAAAAICNAAGNVLAMMPHPERVLSLGAVARSIGGEWGTRRDEALERGGEAAWAASPGLAIFEGLAAHFEVAR
jgi:phosphoribosylformylglycinamidine synthase